MASVGAPILLIFGAGPNIGRHVTELFVSKGYRVATVSRTEQHIRRTTVTIHYQGDLSDPTTIPVIFEKLKAEWGIPTVVIYNGASRSLLDDKDPLSSFSLDQLKHDMSINVDSAILAASHAVEGFKQLPPSHRKTFIHTGNKLNVIPLPRVLLFGMGKSAMAHMIWHCSVAYRDQDFKFYYADERFADGRATKEAMSGQAYAEEYLNLVEAPKQGQWHHTFVKGQGYVDFAEVDRQAVL